MRTKQTRAITLALLVLTSALALMAAQRKQQKAPPKQQPQAQQQQPAQDQTQQPADQQTTDDDAPKQNFGPALTTTGGRKLKDTASAGFNGVDPNGNIDPKKLNEPPTAAETNKAVQLSVYTVNPADLQAFIAEGKLNATRQAK